MINASRNDLRDGCLLCAISALLAGQQALAQEPRRNGPRDPSAAAADQGKIGQAPVDNTMQFLREQSILLKCGEWQFDIGLNYSLISQHYTQLASSISGPVALDIQDRRRLLLMPLDIRYGVTDRLQAFVNLPVGWANTEVSTLGQEEFLNTGGRAT